MAKGEGHLWETVAKVERELALMLSDSCEKWFPAGSFRRKLPVCKNFDIVVIPKYKVRTVDLFGGEESVSLFAELNVGGEYENTQ